MNATFLDTTCEIVGACNLSDIIDKMATQCRNFADSCLDDRGELRPSVLVLVDDELVDTPTGRDLPPGSTVEFLLQFSGG